MKVVVVFVAATDNTPRRRGWRTAERGGICLKLSGKGSCGASLQEQEPRNEHSSLRGQEQEALGWKLGVSEDVLEVEEQLESQEQEIKQTSVFPLIQSRICHRFGEYKISCIF